MEKHLFQFNVDLEGVDMVNIPLSSCDVAIKIAKILKKDYKHSILIDCEGHSILI